jgi:hypothetical protein
MGMPPYTTGPRKVGYALVALGCALAALLTACPAPSATDPEAQGQVVKVKRGSESITGATFLTIDYYDDRPNHTEDYADNAKVANCKVGSVWPRCVKKP